MVGVRDANNFSVQRAIVGADVDVLKKMRKATVPKPKSAATEAALKEVKANKKKNAAAKGASGPRGGASVPKLQQKHK